MIEKNNKLPRERWVAPKLKKIAANLAEAGTGSVKDTGKGLQS